MAALSVEMLLSSTDLMMNKSLTQASCEAIHVAADSANEASKAIMEANDLDVQVTQAFNDCNQIGAKLSEALNEVEFSL